jgi:protease-4
MAGQTMPASGGIGDAVAVIHLEGTIASASSGNLTADVITPDRAGDLLEQAAGNPSVKAVVLHINSPGGSVVASDRIYRDLLAFEKPVVVWMGETAASGGYYIACGGDVMMAHPGSLTGSIGVISQFLNVEELLDKLGVEAVVITSGPRKDIGSPFRDMTEEERAIWAAITDDIYEDFVQVVADARDLPLSEVRELADGRVYTGEQALEQGLLDELGTLDDAIARAGELGGITGEPRVIELRREPTLLDLFSGLQARSSVPTLDEILSWAGVPSLQFRLVTP